MNWFKRIYNEDKFKFLFILTMMLAVTALIVAVIVVPIIFGSFGEALSLLKYYLFSDMGQYFYFAVIDNPYVSKFSTIYFPIGILIMKPLALFSKNPETLEIFANGNYNVENLILSSDKNLRIIDVYNAELIKNPGFWLGILIYYAITFTLIGLLAFKMFNWKSKKQFFYAFVFFCLTGPFIVGIVRGTNVFTALLLIMAFLKWKDSPKRILRELSFVFLALAGVIRLYPFLFGAVLIREKRFVDCIKVFVYSLIFAFAPFLFYEQPLETIQAYFHNLSSFVGSDGRLKDAMNLSIYSMFGYIFYLFSINNAIVVKAFGIIGTISAFVFSASVGIFAKQKFVSFMAIVCGMVLVTPVAYYYVLIFLLIPFVTFLQEKENCDATRKKIYLTIFAFLSFPVTSAIGWYLIQSLVMFALLIFEFCQLFKKDKEKQISNNTPRFSQNETN